MLITITKNSFPNTVDSGQAGESTLASWNRVREQKKVGREANIDKKLDTPHRLVSLGEPSQHTHTHTHTHTHSLTHTFT